MMSQFAIPTGLKEPENSSLYSKMLVYDGENLKDTDPRAKSYAEYRDYAGVAEGMSGISTFAVSGVVAGGASLLPVAKPRPMRAPNPVTQDEVDAGSVELVWW